MKFGDGEVGGDYREVNMMNNNEGSVCICFGRFPFYILKTRSPGS
jgi:hypothetical protein